MTQKHVVFVYPELTLLQLEVKMGSAEDNALADQGSFDQSGETRNVSKNITAAPDAEPRPGHDFSRGEDTGDVQEPMILHGDPITISRCTFQAHIAW